jgi:hypothetical protein
MYFIGILSVFELKSSSAPEWPGSEWSNTLPAHGEELGQARFQRIRLTMFNSAQQAKKQQF